MTKLKIFGKNGKTDVTSEIDPKLIKSWEEQIERVEEDTHKIREHEAKKSAQPFRTNELLDDLINKQTPKWVGYAILILTLLTLFVGIFSLLHSYNCI